MLKRPEVRVLLKESDFLTAGLRGKGRGAYPPSQFILFHPSRKQRWHALLEYLKRFLRKELCIEVCAGIKGTNRGCWETVSPLAVNQKCQAPAVGTQLLATWASCLPRLELIILPFLICMLLLMVLPLVMIFLVLFYLKKIWPTDLHPSRFWLCHHLQEVFLYFLTQIGLGLHYT